MSRYLLPNPPPALSLRAERSSPRRLAIWILGLVLGGVFVASGLNEFYHFVNYPTFAGDDSHLIVALRAVGYMKLAAWLQIVGGLILMSGRALPAALLVLAPFLFNFVLLQFYIRESGHLLAFGMVAGVIALVVMGRSSR